MNKLPLVIINGPTATGKTQLAIELALDLGGEIISADSLQVYRYLDIGTAKPTREERNIVKHHLLDVVNPDEEFNAAVFAGQARIIIENLAQQKKQTIIVGGTGLYIRTLLRGIIETPEVDEDIRNYYRRLGELKGKSYLYSLLQRQDEEAALKINPNDSVRIIRALEVWEQTGESIAQLQKRHSFGGSNYTALKIGLQMERAELKRRISARTEKMIADGLLSEVKSLLDRGYTENLKPLRSLGYRQIIDFLKGRQDWEETVQLIKRDTWHYAKRQFTWFSADKEIAWYPQTSRSAIVDNVYSFLNGCQKPV